MSQVIMTAAVIAISGLVGFFATLAMIRVMMGVPFSKMLPSYGKMLWSVIFAVPLLLFTMGFGFYTALITCFILLSVGPTLGSKLYFGPKDRPFMQLMMFNSGYAIAAILAYLLLRNLV